MGGFRDLIVWQRADELAFQMYRVTASFPRSETYGLISQMRRAAVSVSSNIAEGSGRRHRNETRQFLNIALGSLSETGSLLSLAKRLKFISEEDCCVLDGICREVGAMLNRMYHNI